MKTFQIAMGIRALLTFVLSLFGAAEDKAQVNPVMEEVVVVIGETAKPEHAKLEAPGGLTHTGPLLKTPVQGRDEIRVQGQDTIVMESYKMADGNE